MLWPSFTLQMIQGTNRGTGYSWVYLNSTDLSLGRHALVYCITELYLLSTSFPRLASSPFKLMVIVRLATTEFVMHAVSIGNRKVLILNSLTTCLESQRFEPLGGSDDADVHLEDTVSVRDRAIL